ncbi:MAG: hypothetical protein NC124_18425 [Clostridium sp.]|nr:hypothetical protein [Clostridium sp.]
MKKCGVVGEWYLPETGGCLCDSQMQKCGFVLRKSKGMETVEYVMAESGLTVGIKRQNLLFLPDGNLLDDNGLREILQLATENEIIKILADIPERKELPELYKRVGFSQAYLYRCYQIEEKFSGKQEV